MSTRNSSQSPSGIGQDVGNHGHAACGQGSIGFGRDRVIRPLDDEGCLHSADIAGVDRVPQGGGNEEVAFEAEQLGVGDEITDVRLLEQGVGVERGQQVRWKSLCGRGDKRGWLPTGLG